MPVRIRLRRMGRKKAPHYRVVVADSESPRDGRFVETLGYYKPLSQPARLVVDLERVDFWIGKGAQPSGTMKSLLNKARKGGDASVAVDEVDKEAEKAARAEKLAKRRQAEIEAATEPEEAAADEAPEAEAATDEAPAAEAGEAEVAAADDDAAAAADEAEADSGEEGEADADESEADADGDEAEADGEEKSE